MNDSVWRQRFNELAAQVRRLGIVADVQIGESEISFGENFDERQVRLVVLATIGTLNRLVLEASNVPTFNSRPGAAQLFDTDVYFSNYPSDTLIEALKGDGYSVWQTDAGWSATDKLGNPLASGERIERDAWRACAIAYDQFRAKNKR